MKIIPNESFGFMRMTVERPLRLRWEVGRTPPSASPMLRSSPKRSGDSRGVPTGE